MNPIVITVFQAVLIIVLAPLSIGLVRWFKARFQGRQGAVPWLPYLSLATLLKKENLISTTSSWMLRTVPYAVLSLNLFLILILPLTGVGGVFAELSNFILVGAVVILAAVFLVMGALDVGSSFAGMGASRSLTLVALLEPTLILAFAAFAIATGSSSLDGMVLAGSKQMGLFTQAPYLILSLVALALITLSENARYPVDNPATHLELTMLHEAMVLDYSGPYLAMLEYASALKLTTFCLLIANLVLPWPLLSVGSDVLDLLVVMCATLIKLGVLMFGLAVLESAIAKMRFYRIQEFLTGAFFLALTGVTLAMLSTLL